MITKKGIIKKTTLEQYSRPRTNGIIALNIREDDQLLNVELTNGDANIVIASSSGRAVHFHESNVRPMGRTATGVKAINLDGMVCVQREDATLLVVTEKGYGKRSFLSEYRITNRGGKGVKAMNITEKTGGLVAIKEVVDTDDLMIINRSGITIRTPAEGIRVMGRATQGVRLIRLNENDEISSVEKIENIETEEPDSTVEDEGTDNTNDSENSQTGENEENPNKE